MKSDRKEKWKYDKRSKWNRHWDGRHTKDCHLYSVVACGNICKISGQLFWEETDLLRLRYGDLSIL